MTPEIIDLCLELECTCSYNCEWQYTDRPVLKHWWYIASIRPRESNCSINACLDSCLQTALDCLKQIKAQRTP
jgi:hypothetical protein